MIIGAHSIIYSMSPEADRRFLRDVLEFPNVDVGEGWLIFGLPPAEVAVHPSDENDVHEFYLMCDDIDAFVTGMRERAIACSPVQRMGWGLLTQITLPGGGKLGVYQPRHARPRAMTPGATASPDPMARGATAGRRGASTAGRREARKSRETTKPASDADRASRAGRKPKKRPANGHARTGSARYKRSTRKTTGRSTGKRSRNG